MLSIPEYFGIDPENFIGIDPESILLGVATGLLKGSIHVYRNFIGASGN